ncbi:MAG: hypothetical protein ACM3SR_11930 [Ignavibacteriales bacterium]
MGTTRFDSIKDCVQLRAREDLERRSIMPLLTGYRLAQTEQRTLVAISGSRKRCPALHLGHKTRSLGNQRILVLRGISL